MDPAKFICPHCGKEYDKNKSIIQGYVVDEKDGGMKVVGRKIIYTSHIDSVNIRFCPKCARKREFISKWNKLFTLIVCLILLILFLLYKGFGAGEICFFVLPSIIILLIPMGIVDGLLEKFYFKIDLNKAKEENAYPVPWHEKNTK